MRVISRKKYVNDSNNHQNSYSLLSKLRIKINTLSIRADELDEAAEIIQSQLPHKNRIWINSIMSQDIGADVSHLVKDVQHVEKTGRRRPRTWARAGDREAARTSRNTMGYQIRGKILDSDDDI